MTEENVKADGRPDSRELSESLKTSAFSHRDFCAMRIKAAQKELAHWQEQHDIITAFLTENQIKEPELEAYPSDEPWFDDSEQKESPDQEMAKHVQNLRDTVRNNSGWNYGPNDDN